MHSGKCGAMSVAAAATPAGEAAGSAAAVSSSQQQSAAVSSRRLTQVHTAPPAATMLAGVGLRCGSRRNFKDLQK